MSLGFLANLIQQEGDHRDFGQLDALKGNISLRDGKHFQHQNWDLRLLNAVLLTLACLGEILHVLDNSPCADRSNL
jgi:hypothetical protein